MCCRSVIHGAVGLAKAALGIGLSDDATVETRRAICRACDSAVRSKYKPDWVCRCRECNCNLKAKTMLASESCPLGKWASIVPAQGIDNIGNSMPAIHNGGKETA